MSGDPRWLVLKKLFHAALEIPVSERRRFLDENTPDPELRAQVERLLEQEEASPESELLPRPDPEVVHSRLKPGTKIGQHVIESKLGEGGMGEVYIATDTRLNRTVVLKFLRQDRDFAGGRRMRFLREARAASGLNHPGIVTIYEVGEWQGEDYIAMEYVEGRTLREVLRQPIPVNTAVRYAVQIADAMAAAHEQGIVHRDLKPANIIVTSRGRIKILDFGLAKLTEAGLALQRPKSGTDSGTLSFEDSITKPGVIMGSINYMSPEQAKGSTLDARSDIFALGSILYEMLTGKAAFDGSSQAEVLGAILHVDPALPSSVNPQVNPELDGVVSLCLKKDSAQRVQSMAEVRTSLEHLLESLRTTGGPPRQSSTGPAVTPPPVSKGHRAIVIGAVGVAAVAAIGGLFLYYRENAIEPPATLSVRPITTEGGVNLDPAISYDGQFLAYVSDRSGDGNLDLWLQRIDGKGNPIRLTNTAAAESEPCFSPDGGQILFRSEADGGGVYAIPSMSGVPRLVIPGGHRPRYSPDGKSVVYWTGVDRLPEPSGQTWVIDSEFSQKARQIVPDFAGAIYPVWSPDGKEILFVGTKTAGDRDTYNWWSVAVAGGTPEYWPVNKDLRGYNPQYWEKGRVICTHLDQLRELLVNSRGRSKGIPPRRITSGTLREASPSTDGSGNRIVFASLTSNTNIHAVPFALNRGVSLGPMSRLTSDIGETIPRAADRRTLVYSREKLDGGVGNEIWTLDLATSRRTQVFSSADGSKTIQLSASGRLIAFKSRVLDRDRVLRRISSAGGAAMDACEVCAGPYIWLPEGERVLIVRKDGKQGLWIVDVETGTDSHFSTLADATAIPLAISPDSAWLVLEAAVKNRQDERQRGIFTVAFTPAAIKDRSNWIEVERPASADQAVAFSPAGNLLYYAAPFEGQRSIWAQRLDPRTGRPAAKPAAVLPFRDQGRLLVAPRLNLTLVTSLNTIYLGLLERTGSIWMLDKTQ